MTTTQLCSKTLVLEWRFPLEGGWYSRCLPFATRAYRSSTHFESMLLEIYCSTLVALPQDCQPLDLTPNLQFLQLSPKGSCSLTRRILIPWHTQNPQAWVKKLRIQFGFRIGNSSWQRVLPAEIRLAHGFPPDSHRRPQTWTEGGWLTWMANILGQNPTYILTHICCHTKNWQLLVCQFRFDIHNWSRIAQTVLSDGFGIAHVGSIRGIHMHLQNWPAV